MNENKPTAAVGGDKYIPFSEREGERSLVFFTRDLSEEGLKKVFDKVSSVLEGRVAVKLHTGEAKGPNILPRPWVESLLSERVPNATIVETNTYYVGTRSTTAKHLRTLKTNGWTFCPVDITDADGAVALPVKGGKWFTEMHVGKTLPEYDSLLVLTHFKGHSMGGFGGSNKNIGIGCADGKIGKKEIHSGQSKWSVVEEELMERMSESTKAVVDYFDGKACYINTMRNMSVDCDCAGPLAAPVVTPDVGILASLDIVALDTACVDLVYALPEGSGDALKERIESRHGLRQLSYMQELGLGSMRYTLIDLDNNDAEISLSDAVKHVEPKWKPDDFNTFKGRNRKRLFELRKDKKFR